MTNTNQTLEEIDVDETVHEVNALPRISRDIVIAPDGIVCYITTTMQDFDKRYRQR